VSYTRLSTLTVLVALLTAIHAGAACREGAKASCMRNGCKGVRGCIGGRMQGCEVADSCIRTKSPPDDNIVVSGALPGQDIGILFDGVDASGSFNDRRLLISASGTGTVRKDVGPIGAPSNGNSLVAFSSSRQPARVPALWTLRSDTVTVQLNNSIDFDITFWILSGNFAT
jgi:hypothetical protein